MNRETYKQIEKELAPFDAYNWDEKKRGHHRVHYYGDGDNIFEKISRIDRLTYRIWAGVEHLDKAITWMFVDFHWAKVEVGGALIEFQQGIEWFWREERRLLEDFLHYWFK